jgi:hypothetical protein
MTVKASEVLQRVVWVLQDETSVRWTAAELVQWLNDAQTAAQMLRPEVTETVASTTLNPGSMQDLLTFIGVLPKDPVKIMKLSRNMSTEGRFRAPRLVSRSIMDVVKPDWQSSPPATDCVNYMVDDNMPGMFWVYPPAPAPTDLTPPMQVELYYSAKPLPLQLPDPNALWSDVKGDISVRDRFAFLLVDYVLYRAFMKDAEFGGNGARAKTHFDIFQASFMGEVQGTLQAQPKVKSE